MNNYYIYIYLDPRKFGKYSYKNLGFLYEPFYVGKGKGKRFEEIYWSRNSFFKNKINKIKKLGFIPVIFKLYENISEEESFEFEKQLIKEIGRFDLGTGPLVNMTNGGEGSSGLIFSKEHRKKLSEKNKERVFSEKTRKKISENKKGENNPNFGKSRSKEIKNKISYSKKGYHHSEETKNKISLKNKEKNHPLFGKHHSKKSIELMSRTRKEKFKNNELSLKGESSPRHKLLNKKIIQIKMLIKLGFGNKEISEIYGVNRKTISNIKTGKTWSHIKI